MDGGDVASLFPFSWSSYPFPLSSHASAPYLYLSEVEASFPGSGLNVGSMHHLRGLGKFCVSGFKVCAPPLLSLYWPTLPGPCLTMFCRELFSALRKLIYHA